ncbi:TonB-dependent receptor [Pedobacter hartonius]|uniref:Iron complex outermembrane recepter protein n=1 Tax=Pedobacter hartonius TaxID=425514 RepID=A0A1H3ZTY9_9SPHI|nr:TonB-dependent receptor [Pedobacter hartonius]SEA26734.1 iron complex outermembrane recepter protein [Pedobacter hartonius]
MKKLLTIAIAVLLLPLFTKAQFTISGSVSEKTNQTLLPGANIVLKGTGKGTRSDARGRYELKNLKAGRYILTVSFIGYESQQREIEISADQTADFDLVQSAFLADEVIVMATRATEKSGTTYKNISKSEITANNFGQDLPFIINNTPGVVVTSDAGAGVGYTGIRIRGSDATRVNVTVNGIPMNDSESQGTFWVNMPDFASSVENIQIQRGVGTSTNGAGAFGGSLNIQTSAPELAPYAEVNSTYGSFNTLKNTFKVGTGLIDNKFSFDGRLSRIQSDGFVDRGASLLKSYFLSGAYHGKTDLLRINVFSGTEKTYQSWNGVPESRLRGDIQGINDYIIRNGLNETDAANLLNSDSRKYNSFLYKDQNDNYQQDHYQLLYAKQLGNRFSFNGALHYTYGRGYYEEFKNDQEFSAYGLPNPVINGAPVETTDLVRRRWLNNDFYGATYAFGYKAASNLNLTVGGAYNEYRGKHYGQVTWSQISSALNNFDHYYDGDGNKNDFNIFAKLAYNPVEKLSLFADLQYRRLKYDITGDDNDLLPLNIHDKLNFFNPKVGATYFVDPKSNIYASLSLANKEGNRDDYVNANVGTLPQPERLYDVEAGYRIKHTDFSAGVNVYGMFYKDQLVVTGKLSDVGASIRQNVPKSSRIGVEFDGSYTLSRYFLLNANAAFSRNKIKNFSEYIFDYDTETEVVNNYKNPDISFSPDAVVFGELVYKPLAGFAVALQSKYVSKQYLDNTQNESRKLNGYWVNNARLGYDFSFKGVKNMNIGLLANNILNKKYESNGYTYGYLGGGSRTDENFYFPQAGTNFLLSLNVKF